MLRRTLLRAEVVYNGLGTPREGGAVVLQEAGEGAERRVVAVDDLAAARRAFPDAEEVDAGFAVSPPPVNAHTHLDLSDMPYAPGPYEAFIRAVVAHARAGGRGLAAAERGAAELLAGGVRAVGDIVTDEATMRWLLAHPELTGVAYWEVFAPDPADADRVFEETVARLRAFRALERPGGMRVGLSPHAPHTVSAPLLARLAELARGSDLPLQIHVAEAPGELAFHRDGTGPLADFLRPFLPDWEPHGATPVAYLERLGVLAARPTLVHMVHVTEDDVRAVQRAGCTVVHCPRSNHALGCGRFPWELYARHGVTVALGTDSRGSSPSLSVLEEAAAARALHGARLNPGALVRAAVKGGARALGLAPARFVRGDDAAGVVRWGRLAEAEARPDGGAGR